MPTNIKFICPRRMEDKVMHVCKILLPSAGSTTETHINEREIEDFTPFFDVASQTMSLFTSTHELSVKKYNRRSPSRHVLHIHPFSELDSKAFLKVFRTFLSQHWLQAHGSFASDEPFYRNRLHPRGSILSASQTACDGLRRETSTKVS